MILDLIEDFLRIPSAIQEIVRLCWNAPYPQPREFRPYFPAPFI
jgi:hypothetical protein